MADKRQCDGGVRFNGGAVDHEPRERCSTCYPATYYAPTTATVQGTQVKVRDVATGATATLTVAGYNPLDDAVQTMPDHVSLAWQEYRKAHRLPRASVNVSLTWHRKMAPAHDPCNLCHVTVAA